MPTTYNVREFGARGDGVTNDATAIQSAIDSCHKAGGGTVLIPAGATFLSGSLVLRSNVELHVERGATLQASGNWSDITERHIVSALSSGVVHDATPESGKFLSAKNATNIAVTGSGTIDGAGRHYVLENLGPIYSMPVERPFTLFFIDCEDVTLTDTLYRDGALWTVRLTGCEGVLIDSIRIRNDMLLPNADGIDLDRCRNVRVSNCDIVCPDDAISLKSCEEFPESGACEDITVTNCVIETKSSALVIGVDAEAPIKNVVFNNCVIRNSNRGLSINMGQASHYENILFSNIVIETRRYDDAWWGHGEPIYVSAVPWHDEVGTVRNVRFINILARSENGVYIDAIEPGLIDGIHLENVRVEIDTWTTHGGGRYDRRPFSTGDEFTNHPTAGFYLRNAAGVTIRNCEVAWGEVRHDFYGHAVDAAHSPRLTLEGLVGTSAFPESLDAVVIGN